MSTPNSQEITQPTRLKAIVIALFVVFLWATSWVLIKIGLEEIPPLTFAGLRYVLAFIILLPLAIRIQRSQSTAEDHQEYVGTAARSRPAALRGDTRGDIFIPLLPPGGNYQPAVELQQRDGSPVWDRLVG